MSETAGARFWAIDLHVHTPGSRDVKASTYLATTADEVVQAAIAAKLDAIALTDHNTSSWCDQVTAAADGKPLTVLPGVEISTTEGHLLAVWGPRVPSSTVDEVLIQLGIKKADQGKLDIAAKVGFVEAARAVVEAGGLAIAAHVDRPKGLLKLSVAAQVKRVLLDADICAVEVCDLTTCETISQKLGNERRLACVRGSDTTLPGATVHTVSGIGSRRTWIKASRPDLIGLRHALKDPDLRVRLEEPDTRASHPAIESVTLSGDFFNGTVVLSPDLTCLLGGTGAGKSLILESIRYALDQQVDVASFPQIRAEVDSRLVFGLGGKGVVRVVVNVDGERYGVERAYSGGGTARPSVRQEIGGEWTDVDRLPVDVLRLAAFSQGEVLEFSRQPVGRMSLIDSAVDFGDLEEREQKTLESLRENATELLAQRKLVKRLQDETGKEASTKERVDELSALFDKDIVKQQEGWKRESNRLTRAQQGLPIPADSLLQIPKSSPAAEIEANRDLFQRIEASRLKLQAAVTEGAKLIKEAVEIAKVELGDVKTAWDTRFEVFKSRLDEELKKVKDGASLVVLRGQLEHLQGQLLEIQSKKTELDQVERPRLEELSKERERLLQELQNLRDRRRQLRRARANALNTKMAKIVKLDVSLHPDRSDFRACLDVLKTGSRIKDEVLGAISTHTHPFRFVRAMLASDLSSLTDPANGIDMNSLARLLTNVDDRELWVELLEAQICDMPDRLNVKFRKPEDGSYAAIEQLAPGQRCTAILVVLLADGTDPVIVDQPEDALHAPWIEEYLVDRLRSLRGERQYLFATRSPGIVVSGDAEQIVTMKATSGRGEIEATGSLERYDLNKLTLHHLEGGRVAFTRRSGKLEVSVSDRR